MRGFVENIFAEIKRLEIGLDKTDKQIKEYETEYNVSSDTFQKSLQPKI